MKAKSLNQIVSRAIFPLKSPKKSPPLSLTASIGSQKFLVLFGLQLHYFNFHQHMDMQSCIGFYHLYHRSSGAAASCPALLSSAVSRHLVYAGSCQHSKRGKTETSPPGNSQQSQIVGSMLLREKPGVGGFLPLIPH